MWAWRGTGPTGCANGCMAAKAAAGSTAAGGASTRRRLGSGVASRPHHLAGANPPAPTRRRGFGEEAMGGTPTAGKRGRPCFIPGQGGVCGLGGGDGGGGLLRVHRRLGDGGGLGRTDWGWCGEERGRHTADTQRPRSTNATCQVTHPRQWAPGASPAGPPPALGPALGASPTWRPSCPGCTST